MGWTGARNINFGGPPIEESTSGNEANTKKSRANRWRKTILITSPRDLDSAMFEAQFTPGFFSFFCYTSQ